MSQSWYLLQSGPRPAPENMALDEALLEAAPLLGRPVLRLYGWLEAAATFGYSQRHADVSRLTTLRPLLRRPTGGGLVPHDADWTYTLAFPPTHAWYALKAVASYERVHAWIRASFTRCGITTELSPGTRPETPGECFLGAEQFDLVWHGRKIAGAAQRRTKNGLLIQGSIQPPPDVVRADWQRAFCDAARFDWDVEWTPWEVPEEVERHAAKLAKEKYSRPEHNERR